MRSQLEAHGAAEVFVPRRCEYDLTEADGVRRACEDARPDTIVHLARIVHGSA